MGVTPDSRARIRPCRLTAPWYNCTLTAMMITVDASALISVLVSEPLRDAIVAATKGAELIAPGSLHWEIGNAFSSFLKQRKATIGDVHKALRAYEEVPIRIVEVDLVDAVNVASKLGLYAYDAYLLVSAQNERTPLLTLDKGLIHAAKQLGIPLVEVKR